LILVNRHPVAALATAWCLLQRSEQAWFPQVAATPAPQIAGKSGLLRNPRLKSRSPIETLRLHRAPPRRGSPRTFVTGIVGSGLVPVLAMLRHRMIAEHRRRASVAAPA
jgi:hypothetical protein